MKPDSLDVKSRVADRMGITWGAFSALCRDMYPDAARPIEAYIADPKNHCDISAPVVAAAPASGRVHILRHCRWCGAEIDGKHSLNYYCCEEHHYHMVLHKAALRNRRDVVTRALMHSPSNEAALREELWALKCDIRPGKGMEKQCPQTVAKLKETDTPRNAKLLKMIGG